MELLFGMKNLTFDDYSDNITRVVEEVSPAVVSLHSRRRYPQGLLAGAGSGIIITPDGYILTNSHVISGAQDLEVTRAFGESYQAQLVGEDPDTDLAVVRVVAAGLPTSALGDSDELKVGQVVIAIGQSPGPLGYCYYRRGERPGTFPEKPYGEVDRKRHSGPMLSSTRAAAAALWWIPGAG
jgi:S1-C subfamily serine protease